MAKETGLGDRLYVGAYDLSGDIQSLKEVTGSVNLLDVTDITQSAHERIGGLRDGKIHFTSFFNIAAGRAQPVLGALPTTDVLVSYGHGVTLGNPVASMVAKQLDYNGKRTNDGMYTYDIEADANGFGLMWGQQGTAGLRTDTTATLGTGVDGAASTSFGWAMHYHLTAFVGTDVTIRIDDSTDNISYGALASATTGALTAIGSGRVATASGSTATVKRYWRVTTTTTGGFTSATFLIGFTKHAIAAVTY